MVPALTVHPQAALVQRAGRLIPRLAGGPQRRLSRPPRHRAGRSKKAVLFELANEPHQTVERDRKPDVSRRFNHLGVRPTPIEHPGQAHFEVVQLKGFPRGWVGDVDQRRRGPLGVHLQRRPQARHRLTRAHPARGARSRRRSRDRRRPVRWHRDTRCRHQQPQRSKTFDDVGQPGVRRFQASRPKALEHLRVFGRHLELGPGSHVHESARARRRGDHLETFSQHKERHGRGENIVPCAQRGQT